MSTPTAPNERISIAFQSDKRHTEYAELGALVEGYGFGTVSVYADLMFQPPLMALLTIAGATERIRLGSYRRWAGCGARRGKEDRDFNPGPPPQQKS